MTKAPNKTYTFSKVYTYNKAHITGKDYESPSNITYFGYDKKSYYKNIYIKYKKKLDVSIN